MTVKAGSQKALFTDSEVRRDYLKSKQWCQQHLRVKVHLTGFACVYEHHNGRRDPSREPSPGRWQGSLFSQQRHKIADAIEWIRTHSKYKPRIGVLTCPGFIHAAKEGNYISTFFKNFKKTYDCNNYVWVRELTKMGYPHFHFVADVPEFDPVELSLYWSGLFNRDAKNSVRLGTRPDKNGRRLFWITNRRMAWYLCKYVGKDLGDQGENNKGKRRGYRTFGISQQAAIMSEPAIYNAEIIETWRGLHDRSFILDSETLAACLEQGREIPASTLNPRAFRWKWTGHGQTYVGFVRD